LNQLSRTKGIRVLPAHSRPFVPSLQRSIKVALSFTRMEYYGTNVIGERHVAAVPDDQIERSPLFCVCEPGKRESNRKSKVPLLNNKDGFQKKNKPFQSKAQDLTVPLFSRPDTLDATVDLPNYTVQ